MPRELRPHRARQMSIEEIQAKLGELKDSQLNLRLRNAMGRLDNPLELRHVRRDIAMLNTLLQEHELGIRKLAGGDEG